MPWTPIEELRPGVVLNRAGGLRGTLERQSDSTVEWSCSHSDHRVTTDDALRCANDEWQRRFKELRQGQ